MSSEAEGDLTRKQRREQARTERKAAEQAAAAGAARRRRMTQLGGAVAVVVVAIVAILIATSGGSRSTKVAGEVGKKSPTGELSGPTKTAVAAVTSELGGIPQTGSVLGKATAPVTMAYFGDLECPICKEFTLGALPKVIQNDVRSGKLKIEYRNLETATREPETFRNQQSAALAAGKQNKGWYYIELFYHLQGAEGSGYVTEKYLQGLAEATPGLSLAKWSADRADQSFQATLATDAQEANNDGFNGTPSFLIGKTGGAMKKLEYTSLSDPSSFESAVANLAKA